MCWGLARSRIDAVPPDQMGVWSSQDCHLCACRTLREVAVGTHEFAARLMVRIVELGVSISLPYAFTPCTGVCTTHKYNMLFACSCGAT